jgi:hypothetical protein
VLSTDENIGGKDCFYVIGNHPISGTECHLWIGKDDYLIHKLIKKTKAGVIEIIYHNIFVDINIPKTTFNLDNTK